MENEQEVIDSTNDTETTENTESEMDVEALRKENETLKAQKDHWRKKAEEKPPAVVKSEEASPEGIPQKDIIYIAKADIHEEDIEEVLSLAKAMKWDVKQAHEYLKPRLKELDEKRKTAEMTSTKGGSRSVFKETPDVLISRANKGEEVDPEKLAAARMQKTLDSQKK